jgi:hypothetical protein
MTEETAQIVGPGYLETYSGKIINIYDPRPEDFSLADIAHALARINRFNGQTSRPYSVAEHSLLVANLVDPEFQKEALMHDASEAYLGDLITPIKREITLYQDIENEFQEVISAKFGLLFPIPEEVHLADIQALYLERQQLRPNTLSSVWPCFEGMPLPKGITIPNFPYYQASKRFLTRAFQMGISDAD